MQTSAEGAAVDVDPEESICRVGYEADVAIFIERQFPQTHDPVTGLLRLEEISWQDLKKRGFSVQMKSLYSRASAEESADFKNKNWSEKLGVTANCRVAGVHIAGVKAVNDIVKADGKSAFRVLNTRTDDFPSHAEIRLVDGLDKSYFLQFRQELRDTLGPLRDVDEIDR